MRQIKVDINKYLSVNKVGLGHMGGLGQPLHTDLLIKLIIELSILYLVIANN